MTRPLLEQDLDCPHPPGCTVVSAAALMDAGPLRIAASPADRVWFRVYDAHGGFDEMNPGFGDTRFAPFDDAAGRRVPTIYLADSLEGALLETALRDVGRTRPRVVSESALHGHLHAAMAGQPLRLVDLRDDALSDLGLTRSTVAAAPSEHYPCTRRLARDLHAAAVEGAPADGLVWHSRQAELTGQPQQEVAVVFGDRVRTGRGAWALARSRTASGALLEGSGRTRFDQIAETLGLTVVSDFDS